MRDNLYIVMELVEGATLLDHLNTLAEKKETMPEPRLWSFFTQLCLALRYIHRERQARRRCRVTALSLPCYILLSLPCSRRTSRPRSARVRCASTLQLFAPGHPT